VVVFWGLFLETVQHVDGVIEFRHMQYSECSRGISNPDFPDPSADRILRVDFAYCRGVPDRAEITENNRVIGSSR
jgi:hypothetical protein